MVTSLKVAQYELGNGPLGRVSHNLTFYPNLQPLVDTPVALGGLVAQQLADFLNAQCGWDQFDCTSNEEMIGVLYKGREAINVKVIPPFRLGIHLSSDHAHLSEYVEQFLKAYYPIKRTIWKEVS